MEVITFAETSLAMKVSFNLKNPKAEVSAVRLIVTHKGKVYRKYTGISVKTKQWKQTKKGQFPTDDATADKLKAIRLNLEQQLNEYSTEAEIITAIDRALIQDSTYYTPISSNNGGKPTFWQFFKTWTEVEIASKPTRVTAYNLISSLMGTTANWNEINVAYYNLLVDRMQDKGYSKNYIASVVSKLKGAMSAGFKQKCHYNTDYLQFEQSAELPDTIYLTQSEIDKLWDLDLSDNETQQKARDLFLLGCYTAARFSDYSRLSTANIRNGFLSFTQHKTGTAVTIPVSPKVATILERNDGHAPEMTQANFNLVIKKVCERAGITEPIQVSTTRGRSRVTETKRKCDLVSSHTARRTGATLLAQTGISLKSLMLITGHRSLAAIQHYLRLTAEENARALQDNAFFK